MFWNAQGIVSTLKKVQLEILAAQQKIDIILLCETFLNTHNEFSLRNYKVYRHDRATHGGGVAIAVKEHIKHTIFPIAKTKSIENISIELSIANSSTIVTAAYSPKYVPQFANDIKILTSNNHPFILLGDLNAEHVTWNCNNNNTAGNALFALQLIEPFLIFNTNEHTHYPHSGASPSTHS